MFLAINGIGDLVKIPFGYLLSFLYDLTTNYGVALILFAILVRFILLPATAKAKKSTMKMSRLQPRIQAIQKQYEGNSQAQSAALQQLYKEEGVSMGSGCLWSLLPLLILFPLFRVVQQPLVYMLHETPEVANQIVEFIRTNAPDVISGSMGYEQLAIVSRMPELAAKFPELQTIASAGTLQGIDFSFLNINLGAIPEWKFWTSAWVWDWNHIGGVLIPVLSAASQILSMLISQRVNNSLVTNEKGLQDKETAQNAKSAQTGKMMMWIMPAISLLIGFQIPIAMSLYWLAQGLVTTATDAWLTKKYRKIYDAEDAVRLQRALEEEAIEAEKERIRAERRAANPDGITTNTSKKKMQQQKKQEEDAAKAAAAKEYAAKKGLAVEEEPEKKVMSGINDRPWCKGRAYDPNRYRNTEENK